LAAIASQYQRFKISSVSFEYCPKVGSSATGQVAVNVFPDAQALAPQTFAELASANGAKSGSAWTGIVFSVPNQNLTQIGGQAGGVLAAPINPAVPQDYDRFSTVGTCVIGWVGCAATTHIGTVYVHYTVTVIDPITKHFASTLAMTSADAVGQALGVIDFTQFAPGCQRKDVDAESAPLSRGKIQAG
jgi:hypothetical protein